MKIHLTRLMILAAALLLGLGLVAPAMTIEPHFGDLDTWVRLLNADLTRPSTYSVLSGILGMFQSQNIAIGLVLIFFSCFFPTAKLATMAWQLHLFSRRRPQGALMRVVHMTGKFSMLDVLVLAMLIVAIKGLPGGTQIHLRWGVWSFGASVLLSLVVSLLMDAIERQSIKAREPST